MTTIHDDKVGKYTSYISGVDRRQQGWQRPTNSRVEHRYSGIAKGQLKSSGPDRRRAFALLVHPSDLLRDLLGEFGGPGSQLVELIPKLTHLIQATIVPGANRSMRELDLSPCRAVRAVVVHVLVPRVLLESIGVVVGDRDECTS